MNHTRNRQSRQNYGREEDDREQGYGRGRFQNRGQDDYRREGYSSREDTGWDGGYSRSSGEGYGSYDRQGGGSQRGYERENYGDYESTYERGGYGGGQYGRGSEMGGYGGQYGRGSEMGGYGGQYGRGSEMGGYGGQYGRDSEMGGYGGQYGRGSGMAGRSDMMNEPITWTYTEYWLIPGPFTGRGPQNYQRSDERLTEEVNERLTQHGQLDASNIEVKVEQGVATLTGTVDSRHAKRMAEEAVESCQGVKDVNNQLRVHQDQNQQHGQNGGNNQGRSSGESGSMGQMRSSSERSSIGQGQTSGSMGQTGSGRGTESSSRQSQSSQQTPQPASATKPS